MKHIPKLSKNNLVKGLLKIYWKTHLLCEACQQGKYMKTSFKSKDKFSTSRPLELLHMDLFGQTRKLSLGGKKYDFVIVDDHSRYTWVYFLAHKQDSFKFFEIFCKRIQNEKGFCISSIKSDHETKFENAKFRSFCEKNGIFHNFSSLKIPQQNGVVERKNRTMQEMARTMLCENSLPKHFLVEAVNTTCYVQNRILIIPFIKKTPYELWEGRRPNISYFHPFGCECFILNTKDQLGMFDSKTDKGIFLGYSGTSKAYKILNSRTLVVEEFIHVKFYNI